jgi:hypothetical protein
MVMPSRCPFCGNEVGDCRPIGGCEVCHPPVPDPYRCKITGNPCGTDTWEVNHPCQCENCQKFLRSFYETPS